MEGSIAHKCIIMIQQCAITVFVDLSRYCGRLMEATIMKNISQSLSSLIQVGSRSLLHHMLMFHLEEDRGFARGTNWPS